MSDLPKSIWSGEVAIGDLVLKVHVLDNGMRIIDEESIAKLLHWMDEPLNPLSPSDVKDLALFVCGKGVPG